MNPERWQRVESLYHSALNLQAVERDAYLAEACAGDVEVLDEVLALIANHERPGSFIDSPVFDLGVRAMAQEQALFGAGKKVGHYVIQKIIGRGGMGEVYLAEDPRLGRKVALKLLPRDMKGDQDRVQRFKLEGRAASAVSHPNIAHIYDVGESDGLFFTAIEYVDGITLRRLIDEGKLGLSGAVDIAAQVAEALAAAHAAGVVHRDVKPENVMVRHDGYVKVLDFGLAKLVEHLKADTPSDRRDTASSIFHSEPGVVMGTVAYMSPEQARGLPVDARTDVWSLGVVLYEMLTGRRPFEGDTMSDVLASILNREPEPLTCVLPGVPAEVERVVAKALMKDPASRHASAETVAAVLRKIRRGLEQEGGGDSAIAQAAPGAAATILMKNAEGWGATDSFPGDDARTDVAGSTRRTSSVEYVVSLMGQHKRAALLVGASLLLLAGSILYVLYSLKGPGGVEMTRSRREMSMTKLTSGGGGKYAAISPDGKYVAYVRDEDAGRSLWLRQVGTTSDIQIGTPGDYGRLTFSPDGTHLYYTDFYGNLFQMPVLGGVKKKLMGWVDSPVTFSPDGRRFAFLRDSPGRSENSLVVANSDGTGEQVIARHGERDMFSHARPSWSPDGKSVVCATASGDPRAGYVNVIEVRVEDGTERVFSPRRWFEVEALAWLTDGSGLVVLASEPERVLSPQIWRLSYPDGEVQKITNDLNTYTDLSLASGSNALVTVEESATHAVWMLPDGDARRARQIAGGPGTYEDLRWTPDGRLIFSSNSSGIWELFTLGSDGRDRKQLTVSAGANGVPVFTPDGRYIIFTSLRAGTANIWRMDADGGNPKQLTKGNWEENAVCSPDGQWVVYEARGMGLWKVSIEGGDVVQLTEGASTMPAISPDGKLIAFGYKDGQALSQLKVAILPFEGGRAARFLDIPVPLFWRGVKWLPDGSALIYIDTHGGVSNLWSQPIEGGPPKQLTDFTSEEIFSFDWSRDGKRLAVVRGSTSSDVVMVRDFK